MLKGCDFSDIDSRAKTFAATGAGDEAEPRPESVPLLQTLREWATENAPIIQLITFVVVILTFLGGRR